MQSISNNSVVRGRILIVDDSSSIREFLEHQLINADYIVYQAPSGKEALDEIYKKKFDLILLDLVMPGLDGIAVLHIIRQSYSEAELPVIILTSRKDPGEITLCLERGARDFLSKPPEINVLLARIKTQVQRKQATEQLRQSQEYLEVQVKNRTHELQQTIDRLNTEESLRIVSENKVRILGRAVDQSPVSVVITDTHGVIEYINEIACKTIGLTKDDLIGKLADTTCCEQSTFNEYLKRVTEGKEWQGEWKSQAKNGSPYWEHVSMSPVIDSNNDIAYILIVKEDITTTKEFEARLKHQANYDALTQLPNRLLAYDRLKKALQMTKRDSHCVVVLFLDIDRFKDVNDTLGHAAGDQLITAVAHRLSSCFRESDTVARLSGDEFLCLFTDDSNISTSAKLVARVLKKISAPLIIEGVELRPTASIGLACSSNDGKDVDELLRRADAAMYQSKRSGRNQFHFFDNSMTEGIARRMEVNTQLMSALSNDELSMVYQPILDKETGKAYALEGLMRWNNPKLGFVPPDEFIGIAESSGIILEIGTWCIKECVKSLKLLRSSGQDDLKIAINISPRQFGPNYPLADIIDREIKEHDLPANAIELEVTEGLFLHPDEPTMQTLDRIRESGYLLSMDDFGTGFAALSNLVTFKFDVVKIDQIFIKDVLNSPRKQKLVHAIIAMAKKLNLKTIAEGVEDHETHQFLLDNHCDLLQGYHFSRPLSFEDVSKFLADSKV